MYVYAILYDECALNESSCMYKPIVISVVVRRYVSMLYKGGNRLYSYK